MKRIILVAAATAAVAVPVGAVILANTDSASAEESFVLDLKQIPAHVVDEAPTGDMPTPGDIAMLTGVVSRDGREVGKSQGVCFTITAEGGSQCSFTVTLPDGQLQILAGYGPGINADGPKVREPIVGGTGKYAGVHGYSDGEETGDDTARETVHLWR